MILPQASSVKNLKPANVLIVGEDGVQVNNQLITNLATVRAQQDWLVEPIRKTVSKLISEGQRKKATIGNRFAEAVSNIKDAENKEPEIDEFRKMTIQADREMDFLTLKKVMYTVTEAGIYEINFAVLKRYNKDTN